MPPVAGERPHLTGPASRFDSLRPFAAHQNVRTVDLIECTMARAILRDPFFLAADAHDERLTLHAHDCVHARHLQEIGHVLSVVDLIKECLLCRVHIHAGDEKIFGLDRHQTLPLLQFTALQSATVADWLGTRPAPTSWSNKKVSLRRRMSPLTAHLYGPKPSNLIEGTLRICEEGN